MDYATLCKRIDSLYAAGDRRDALFGAIRQLAMRRLNDDDAAQDVVIEVLTSIDSFTPFRPFAAWVNTIISRRGFGIIREAIEATKAGTPGVEVPLKSTRFSPDYGAIDNPFVRQVAELIGQGYQQPEIATKLEVPLGTLKRRLHDYRNRPVVVKTPGGAEVRKAA
jgi:DNA-directed RNA polymerase specialized sigma24 family protein